jgi:acyl carrier protein
MTDNQAGETRAAAATAAETPSAEDIERWLTNYLASLLECDATAVDARAPFNRLGIDSSAAVGMTGDLEPYLGFEIEPTLPYDYPTVEKLARHLAEAARTRAAGARA